MQWWPLLSAAPSGRPLAATRSRSQPLASLRAAAKLDLGGRRQVGEGRRVAIGASCRREVAQKEGGHFFTKRRLASWSPGTWAPYRRPHLRAVLFASGGTEGRPEGAPPN